MKPIDELLQEFRESHNIIIQSLNDAEKGHAETLAAFISELEKRKTAIEGLNQDIERFNHLVTTMATRLVSINKRLNDLDILSGDIEFKLKHLQENVTVSLEEVSKEAFKGLLKKTRFLFTLNLICMAFLIYLIIRS